VLGENSWLSIKDLSLKTVTLVALASLLRVSEIAAISTDSLVFFRIRRKILQHNGALQEVFLLR
jgi:hypothetical protein